MLYRNVFVFHSVRSFLFRIQPYNPSVLPIFSPAFFDKYSIVWEEDFFQLLQSIFCFQDADLSLLSFHKQTKPGWIFLLKIQPISLCRKRSFLPLYKWD